MKAIRKKIKPPLLMNIIKQQENDSDASTESSNLSSISDTIVFSKNDEKHSNESREIDEWVVEKSTNNMAGEKKHNKIRVFEKRRSPNNNPSFVRPAVPPNNIQEQSIAQDLTSSSDFIKSVKNNSVDSESTLFPLQELNPKSFNQTSSGSVASLTCSVNSNTTTSTYLSQNNLLPTLRNQLNLITKIMDDIEKNGKQSDIYPNLPTNNNRRIIEPIDEKSIALYAGLAALGVLTLMAFGITAYMYTAMYN